MERNEYKQLMPNLSRPWENHLSFENRLKFIEYYKEGYAIYKIAKTFQVTAGTVEYHLRVAQVYVPGKKPTKRGIEIQSSIQVLLPPRTISKITEIPKAIIPPFPTDASLTRILNAMLEEDDEHARDEKMWQSFPKCYKEYLQRAKERHPIEYSGSYAGNDNAMFLHRDRIDHKMPQNNQLDK